MPYIGLALESRAYDPIFYYKSDEKKTYYCDPACFEWLKSIGKDNDASLSSMQWMEIMLPIESLATKPISDLHIMKTTLETLSHFPLIESDTPYLISIYNYFKGFESRKQESVKERMERAIVYGSYPSVPVEVMTRLVMFTFEQFVSSNERIRVSLSERIRPFLQLHR